MEGVVKFDGFLHGITGRTVHLSGSKSIFHLHISHMVFYTWRTLAWPHHFTKRGGLGPLN